MDVALRIGDLPNSSLVARKLAEVDLIMVASPDYARLRPMPDRPEALAEHHLVDLSASTEARSWRLIHQTDATVAEVPIAASLATPDPGLVLDMALQGLGIATVPRIYALDGLASGE